VFYVTIKKAAVDLKAGGIIVKMKQSETESESENKETGEDQSGK
jgi:hypothetical protein